MAHWKKELKDSGCFLTKCCVLQFNYSRSFLKGFQLKVDENKEGFQNGHGPAVITWPVSHQVKRGPVILEELEEIGVGGGAVALPVFYM